MSHCLKYTTALAVLALTFATFTPSFAGKPAPPPPDPARFVFAYVAEGNFSAKSLMVMYRDGSSQTVLRQGAKSVGHSQPSWSPDGKYIYFVGYTGSGYAIQRMQPVPGSAPVNIIGISDPNIVRPVVSPKLAPDGRYKIAFADVVNGTRRILLMNEDASGLQVIADDGIDQFQPTWSPNADAIAYMRVRQVGSSLYNSVVKLSLGPRLGGGLEVLGQPLDLTGGSVLDTCTCFDPRWAHNSNKIVVRAGGNPAGTLFLLDADLAGAVSVLEAGTTNEHNMDWSPDDRKIVLSRSDSIDVIDSVSGIQEETLATSAKTVFRLHDPAWRPTVPVQ